MNAFSHIQCRDVPDVEADPFVWARHERDQTAQAPDRVQQPRLRDVAVAIYSGETLGPDLFPARNQARARQRLRDLKEQRREARQAGDEKMAAALSVSINQLGSTLV
jgi:hypothetical protein